MFTVWTHIFCNFEGHQKQAIRTICRLHLTLK